MYIQVIDSDLLFNNSHIDRTTTFFYAQGQVTLILVELRTCPSHMVVLVICMFDEDLIKNEELRHFSPCMSMGT